MTSNTIFCKIDQKSIEKFTKQQRELGARITLSDEVCSGLKLVINNRSASWTYAYRKRGYLDGGKRHPQRTMKLGDPTTMSAPEARLAADRIKAAVRAGADPAVEQRKATAARQLEEARRKTNADWLSTYNTEQMADGGTKYQRDEVRNVRLALDELSLAKLYPDEVTAKHLRNLADLHRDRPATARHRFGAFSRFLDYLLDEEAISTNPALAVSKRSRPKTPQPRTNYYTVEQLGLLWHIEGINPEYRRYLRFMITTPLRAIEGANLIWSQIDHDAAQIKLEAIDVKNNEYFVMPLNHLALSIIGEAAAEQTSLVFPLSKANKPMKSWSYFNTKIREATGIENFILHDLRRTFSTLMSEHTEISETLIDGLLNRKQSATRGGVIRHYQHAKNLEKRRQVMKQWGTLLEGWI